jgi:hypothetical protein
LTKVSVEAICNVPPSTFMTSLYEFKHNVTFAKEWYVGVNTTISRLSRDVFNIFSLNMISNSISFFHWVWYHYTLYLTLRLVSSLNNPQNSEMKFCENMKLTCWKSA